MGISNMGPACPECGALTRVVHVKQDVKKQMIVRRRACHVCDHKFYTAQPVEKPAKVRWTDTPLGSRPIVEAA